MIFQRIIAPILLAVLLLVTSCSQKAPSRFEQAQTESTKRGATPAVVKEAEQGSSFNKFFPKSGDGYDRVYTQEKKGFAEAKLNQGGKTVAMLAISDTVSLPNAAQKFQSSTKKINAYPAVEIGNTQTAVLVGHYQVKVLSRDPSFTQSDREAWLRKFDLNGIAQLR